MKHRVVAYGYCGYQNFGDDLFRLVVSERASDLWPGSESRVFAPTAGFANINTVSRHLSHIYQSPTRGGSAAGLFAAVAGIAWGQTIALCGGSTLRALSGVQRTHAAIARRHLRAFQGLGLSVGPFTNTAQATEVEHFLANFTRLVVRDTPSLETLNGVLRDRAVLGGDLAALYRYPPARRSKVDIHIGIMPCASGPRQSRS